MHAKLGWTVREDGSVTDIEVAFGHGEALDRWDVMPYEVVVVGEVELPADALAGASPASWLFTEHHRLPADVPV